MRRLSAALFAAAVLVTPALPAAAANTHRPRHVHRYDDGGGYDRARCYDDECYDDDGDGYGQRYDQNYGSRDDRNRNRGRNRGAFSPGPFDRSPIDMRNACISLDCSGRSNDDRDRRDQTPPDEGERS